MATPTDDDRTLLTVTARMTAKPDEEQELREGREALVAQLDDLLVGSAHGPVTTERKRIA